MSMKVVAAARLRDYGPRAMVRKVKQISGSGEPEFVENIRRALDEIEFTLTGHLLGKRREEEQGFLGPRQVVKEMARVAPAHDFSHRREVVLPLD